MSGINANDPSRRQFMAATGVIGTGLLASGAGQANAEPPLAPPDKQPPDLKIPKAVDRKVGWAVVGLGKLALEEVMPAFGQCELSQPVALVSGHADKAKQVAQAYDLDVKNIYSYDNYDQIALNRDIEVVYIILPNNMHAEYTIRALKAGKHVLCEKPMATNVKECEQMVAAAKDANRSLMIAYRLRYEPFNQKVIELCEKEELGKVKLISASNSQQVNPPNIRLSSELGGGPLGDVGIYCLNAARYITRKEPVEVSGFSHQPKSDPRFREVPESVSFMLRFADGVEAHCSCSFGAAESRFYRVECTKGVIELEESYAYRGQQLYLKTEGGERRLKIEPVNHFAAEMDHLSDCVIKKTSPRTPGSEGLADMRAIAAIEESARTGRIVRVG
jgi:predicted dehydrogenase